LYVSACDAEVDAFEAELLADVAELAEFVALAKAKLA
jgi:hypothetical protein